MIALLALAVAHAGEWDGLRGTADTLDLAEVVVRMPTGRSAIGVGPTTELFVTPFDATAGGTRVGLEQGVVAHGPVAWSLAPSVAPSWTLSRTGLRLESALSAQLGADRVTLLVAPDLNVMRTTTLSDEASSAWHLDRTHVPVALTFDHTWSDTVLRATARVGVVDEGRALTWGAASVSWLHRWRGLHVELGAGLFVGRPSEHTFLGTYERVLVAGYPKVDVWWQRAPR